LQASILSWFCYKNSNNFKYSIINILNLDTNIIETRINEELFDTYINNILKKELKDSDWKIENYSIQFGEFWGVIN